MEVEVSSRFVKKAKKLSSDEKMELLKRTRWFEKSSQDSRLKNHALTGKMKGTFAFSITHGKRVVYELLTKDSAIFIDVGSHEEVYR